MMINVVQVIFILSGLALIAPGQTFAQSGNTGGNLGKTNKSVSGTIGKSIVTRKRKPIVEKITAKSIKPDACKVAIGSWTWINFGSTTVITISATGNTTALNGYHGPWKCSNGKYTITWQNGISESFKISSDGTKLIGRNFLGGQINGKRM